MEDVTRALVIAAHPDDIEYAAAGTVAAWTAAGIEVSYCLVTYGESGGFDDTPRERVPALRQAEQRAAADELGVRRVTFLGFPDGDVSVSVALRRSLTREIRLCRPQRVLCHSPQRNWERILVSHPDHLESGEAALRAVYPDARNPFAFPELVAEGLPAWAVSEVWMMGAPTADVNRYVDVTATFDHKLAALRAHASQTAHMSNLDHVQRARSAALAKAARLPDGHLAEGFHVIDARTP